MPGWTLPRFRVHELLGARPRVPGALTTSDMPTYGSSSSLRWKYAVACRHLGVRCWHLHSQRDVGLGEKASVELVMFLVVEGRAMLDSTGFVRKNGTPAVW
jgi:hypothetical protein